MAEREKLSSAGRTQPVTKPRSRHWRDRNADLGSRTYQPRAGTSFVAAWIYFLGWYRRPRIDRLDHSPVSDGRSMGRCLAAPSRRHRVPCR